MGRVWQVGLLVSWQNLWAEAPAGLRFVLTHLFLLNTRVFFQGHSAEYPGPGGLSDSPCGGAAASPAAAAATAKHVRGRQRAAAD